MKLRLLFLLAAIAAAAQPRWGLDEEAVQARGVDLTICLDVSASMLARDVAPDRLGAAKAAVRELIAALGPDRLGLILFAGEAIRAAPLTRDHQAFLQFLDAATPARIRVGGSDFAAALAEARRVLAAAPGTQKTVLFLSDGEDRGQALDQQLQACREEGITLHTVSVGSTVGSKIPWPTPDGGESYLRQADGREVLSSAHPEALARLAEATDGSALTLGAATAPSLLVSWYREELLPQARLAALHDGNPPRRARFQWPLGLALGLALLLLVTHGGRRS